ncbi:enzymatic polyprotein, putative [Rhizophagus irregularis DAOM 181602=DAOM 197198]|nr:enzymatic polyprotein, putative [Rhizophagus irregularis DAOM 181602=DAOM 197198]
MRTELEVEDQLVNVIIDTGAAVSVITDKLRRRLNIPIFGKSKFRCTIANGQKIAALGKANITLRYKDELEILKEVEVIDSEEEDLILGNDIWKLYNAKINFEDHTLRIEEQGEIITIPVGYEREAICESEESEDDEEYESNDEGEMLEPSGKFMQKLSIGKVEEPIWENMVKLLLEYQDILEYDEEIEGRTKAAQHEIKIKEGVEPIKQRRYKETDEKAKFISEEVDKLLKQERIRKSKSPWSSPVTLAGKKTGKYRFCIDYRKLNKITIIDSFPLPRIDELLDKYRKAKWFSSIDLAAGFNQVEMKEEDKEKTAFVCSKGLFEYNVMPFGLTNAPATFQRLMDEILEEYINDFTIWNMWKKNIEFLGHIVGNDGLRPDDKKIEKIKEMKAPTTVKEVRSFLGLCSYYRKFVKNFSKIARPISDLRKKGIPFIWGREQQEAFEKLKEKLIQYPILRHPDWKKEFLLITDASGKGLGAVLSQKDEKGKEVVIAYASRSLLPAEENYPITELECLGIVWGIQHFHKYLIDRKFKVITDHSALKGLMNAKIPKGKRARWVMELQQYNFEVIHRSGKENTNADALSRLLKIVEDQPEIVIIDGVDGLGKTSIVQNLIEEWEKQGLKVRFNTYKRRRKDKDEFYESKMETEWKFRKEVVEQINRRMLEYDEDTDIIILDKSPYCEYYYQKTKSFDRGLITPHGNHEMEKEIFRLKETIDKSIVIFLEKDSDVCWKNYIGRETKKTEKSSYPTLKKDEYLDMVRMFEENQGVYKDTKRYSRVKVKNDNSSWRKVFKEVEKWRRAQN